MIANTVKEKTLYKTVTKYQLRKQFRIRKWATSPNTMVFSYTIKTYIINHNQHSNSTNTSNINNNNNNNNDTLKTNQFIQGIKTLYYRGQAYYLIYTGNIYKSQLRLEATTTHHIKLILK